MSRRGRTGLRSLHWRSQISDEARFVDCQEALDVGADESRSLVDPGDPNEALRILTEHSGVLDGHFHGGGIDFPAFDAGDVPLVGPKFLGDCCQGPSTLFPKSGY